MRKKFMLFLVAIILVQLLPIALAEDSQTLIIENAYAAISFPISYTVIEEEAMYADLLRYGSLQELQEFIGLADYMCVGAPLDESFQILVSTYSSANYEEIWNLRANSNKLDNNQMFYAMADGLYKTETADYAKVTIDGTIYGAGYVEMYLTVHNGIGISVSLIATEYTPDMTTTTQNVVNSIKFSKVMPNPKSAFVRYLFFAALAAGIVLSMVVLVMRIRKYRRDMEYYTW